MPAGGGRAVVALALGILLGFGAVQLVGLLVRPLFVLALAITLASTLAPAVKRLTAWMPRPAAVTAVYLALAGVLVAAGWFVAPTVARQGRELQAELPDVFAQFQQRLERLLPAHVSVQDAMSVVARQVGSQSASALNAGLSGAFEVLVIVFLSAYFLIAAPRAHRFALQLAAGTNRRRTSRTLLRITHAMGGYFRGVAIDGAIIGTLTWIVLLIIGRPFAAPLGVLAAFGELVPYVGPIVAAIPAIGLALLDSPQHAVIVGLAYVAIQQIEGHLVTPLVMHAQTDITPGTVLFAVVAGWTLAGILGAIAAVPLFAAARVLVVWVLLPRARCRTQRQLRRHAAAPPRMEA